MRFLYRRNEWNHISGMNFKNYELSIYYLLQVSLYMYIHNVILIRIFYFQLFLKN